MLTEQTIAKLNALKLYGMRDALTEQLEQTSYADLSFEERLGMLVDREWADKEGRKYSRRIKAAKLKMDATLEGIDYRAGRGLDASLIRSLADGRFVTSSAGVIITGSTGTGKTYISNALAERAIRLGHSAFYVRAPRLFESMRLARADGSIIRFLAKLGRTDVLVIDDFGLAPLTDTERRDLLEVVEEKHGSGSVIMASQLPVASWHELIGEPTLADAILDRLVHNSYRVDLKGPSMRKRKKQPQKSDDE
jgi:DNA replication protein DnaC